MALEQITAASEARDISKDLHNNDYSALQAEINDINKFGNAANYGPKAVYDHLSPSAKNEIALQTDKDGHQFLEFAPRPIGAPAEVAHRTANGNDEPNRHSNESNQNPGSENTAPETAKPDSAKPADSKPESAKDDSSKPDSSKPDSSSPDSKPSDTIYIPSEIPNDSTLQYDPNSSNLVQRNDSYIRQ